jgi:alginate export protein
MSIRRKLAHVVLSGTIFGASLPAQSIADAANRDLPNWLHLGGLYRVRVEDFLNRGFQAGQEDAHLLTRFRIDLSVQPASWMKFVFEGQDARIYFHNSVPNAPPNANPMDLRLGYLELGDTDQKPVTLRAGRQELNFGEQRLLGSFDWINVGRTFDAVRLILRHRGYRVDLFASSVVNPTDSGFDRPQTGNNLHGLYGHIEKWVPGAAIEPYLLWRLAPNQVSESGVGGNLDLKTIGLRWAGGAKGRLDYGTEMALETGSLGPDKVRAWGGHWTAGYTFSAAAWKPRFSGEYNYATGDRNPHDAVRGTFDNLYPSPHDKYGLADQVGWRNIHDIRAGWDAKPAPQLSVAINYHNWWLATIRDALYTPMGAVAARTSDSSAGTHVGQETDLEGSYAVSNHLQIAMGLGHIFPGKFLRKATAGAAYTFPFAMVNYMF